MSKTAKVTLTFLLVLAAIIVVVVAIPDRHAGEEDYWRDISGNSRPEGSAQIDWKACSKVKLVVPDVDDPDISKVETRGIAGTNPYDCMARRGWKLIEAGASGPENAGRFILLIFLLPATILCTIGILVTRGRYRVAVLYLSIGVTSVVGAYLGVVFLVVVLHSLFFY